MEIRVPGIIYVLIDPRTNRKRYVGYTGVGLVNRIKRHLQEARRGVRTHKCNWLRELIAEGLAPLSQVIEEVSDSWQGRERFWIAHYRESESLVNESDGGDGSPGHAVSESARATLSAKLRGRVVPEDQKRRMSEVLRGKKKSPEHVAKLTGVERSEATRRRMSEARKGWKYSDHTRQKISETLRSKPFDERRAQQLAAARQALKEKRDAKRNQTT